MSALNEKKSQYESVINVDHVAIPETDDIIESICNFNSGDRQGEEPTDEGTFEEELYKFELIVYELIFAFIFFKIIEAKKKYPQLRGVARAVLGVLPSPAYAERAFSRAQFLTESRKNRLTMDSVKLRLQCLCD